MDRPVVAVVLAGGTGTRLSPLSRPDRPKQFCRLGGDRSLLQRTVDRAGFADERYVLTRSEYADLVCEQTPAAGLLVEPEPKGTGPALVYAAHRLREQVGECVVCVLPSDHHVAGEFVPTMERAIATATATGGLVTVGVTPTRPATGYGYIEPGAPVEDAALARKSAAEPVRVVESFVEKPDAKTAKSYLEAGYRWNAGLFTWTPAALLAAAEATPLAPLVSALEAGREGAGFETVPSVSVDRGILERASDRYVVPAEFEWDDLGTWDAVWRVLEQDGDGTVTLGQVETQDTSDSVVATDGRVVTAGIEGLVVASFDGRTVVMTRDRAEEFRMLAAVLDADDEW